MKSHRRESSTHRLIYAQAAADVGAERFADVSAEPRANAGPDHIPSPEQRADVGSLLGGRDMVGAGVGAGLGADVGEALGADVGCGLCVDQSVSR